MVTFERYTWTIFVSRKNNDENIFFLTLPGPFWGRWRHEPRAYRPGQKLRHRLTNVMFCPTGQGSRVSFTEGYRQNAFLSSVSRFLSCLSFYAWSWAAWSILYIHIHSDSSFWLYRNVLYVTAAISDQRGRRLPKRCRRISSWLCRKKAHNCHNQ